MLQFTLMRRPYIFLIVVEAVIILLLLIGAAVLFFLLYTSKPISSLPIMPTYDPGFFTTTPVSAATPTPIPPATFTQTSLPLFILNGTPVYPTAPMGQTCRNILYPVAIGQQWSYQANARGRILDLNMSVLSVNGSQGNVLVNIEPLGASKQVQVHCDGDVIRSFPFLSMDVLLGNSVYSAMSAIYVSGALAPNEAAFLKNNWALAWSSQYLVSGNTVITWNSKQFDVTLNNSLVTLTCQTLGAGDAAFETVTVAAGSFRALKVVCTEQVEVTATVNGTAVTGTATGRSYQWFALNTGLVKM
jgi:hypothetical protein